MSEIADDWKSV
nr:hypothetical protein [Tanacetum cinerariifolium]